MTAAPASHNRGHLSIGEVLSLLQDEFPDVTISKIRFLESQGLLDPERTPSGYRKFYDQDIDRLRSILRLQKEHYLPLKVIKDRLDSGELPLSTNGVGSSRTRGEAPPEPAAPEPSPPEPSLPGMSPTPRPVVAVPERSPGSTRPTVPRPAPADSRTSTSRSNPPAPATAGGAGRSQVAPSAPTAPGASPSPGPSSAAGTTGGRARRGERPGSGRPPTQPRAARANPTPPGRAVTPPPAPPQPPVTTLGSETVSLSIDELAEASGLSVRDIRDLERFGLIEAHDSGAGSSYDSDALVVAQTAAGFLQHGIQARHMRTYKVAVDREAGLFEQIVSPVLKQRNPEARTRASRTVTELIRLGEVMRAVLLRRELRDHLGGGR